MDLELFIYRLHPFWFVPIWDHASKPLNSSTQNRKVSGCFLFASFCHENFFKNKNEHQNNQMDHSGKL